MKTYTLICSHRIKRKITHRVIARGLIWPAATNLMETMVQRENDRRPVAMSDWTGRIFFRQLESA
jgi:hypothetical protein